MGVSNVALTIVQNYVVNLPREGFVSADGEVVYACIAYLGEKHVKGLVSKVNDELQRHGLIARGEKGAALDATVEALSELGYKSGLKHIGLGKFVSGYILAG